MIDALNRLPVKILYAIAWVALLCAEALAAERVALVVGNGAYTNFDALTRPANDARAYTANLSSRGFEVVGGVDLTLTDFERELDRFEALANDAKIAVVIYVGHGLSIDSGSDDAFLVPIDAPRTERVSSARTLKRRLIALSEIQERLNAASPQMRVFIVDACTNNPFGETRRLSGGLHTMSPPKNLPNGLSGVKPGSGEFWIYSTGQNEQALEKLSDSDASPHTVFGRMFIPEFRRGVTLTDALNAAKRNVRLAAANVKDFRGIPFAQRPYSVNSLEGESCIDANCGDDFVDSVRRTVAPDPTTPPSPTETYVETASLSLPNTQEVALCEAVAIRGPTYKTISQSVVVEEASEALRIVPATFKSVGQTVVAEEAHHPDDVLRTVTETVVVEPAYEQLQVVPATYRTVTETVVVQPASEGLRFKAGSNTEVESVSIPARTRTISRRVQDRPASVRAVQVPAKTRSIQRRAISQPSGKEATIPGKTATIQTRVVDSPASVRRVSVPAKTATIQTRVIDTPSRQARLPAVCGYLNNVNAIRQIEAKLISEGLLSGNPTGVESQALLQSIQSYQRQGTGWTSNGLLRQTAERIGFVFQPR